MGRHSRFYATPAEKPDKPVDRATVKRVVGTFRPYRGKVWIVGVLIAITSGLGVVNPLLIVYIFNHGLFGLGSPATCQGVPCPNGPGAIGHGGEPVGPPEPCLPREPARRIPSRGIALTASDPVLGPG